MEPTDPVTTAWRFVADNMHSIEKCATRWCPKWLDRMEFEQLLATDVFDAHARGLYRPEASVPNTWIYTRARLKCTEEVRREKRRQREVSTSPGPKERNAPPRGKVGDSITLSALVTTGWGSHEATDAKATLSSLIQGASEAERAACFSFLAEHNATDCRAATGFNLTGRDTFLRQMGAKLERRQCRA